MFYTFYLEKWYCYIVEKKSHLFEINLLDFNRLKYIALLFVDSNFKQFIQFRFCFRAKLAMQLRFRFRFRPNQNVSFGASFVFGRKWKVQFRSVSKNNVAMKWTILLSSAFVTRIDRNHNLRIYRASLKSQAHQSISLFTSVPTNQRGCSKCSQVRFPVE